MCVCVCVFVLCNAAMPMRMPMPMPMFNHQPTAVLCCMPLVHTCCRLLQEQAAWEQLLQHYKAMAGTEEDGAANPEASSAAAPAAADADADATMVAAMEIEGQGDQKQQQQPVEGQRHGRQGAGAAAADDDPDANPAGVAIAQEELAAAGGGTTAAPGPVSYEQESVLRGVQLKVEALTALVAKMEHLVSRAEATARTLQVGVGRGQPGVEGVRAVGS